MQGLLPLHEEARQWYAAGAELLTCKDAGTCTVLPLPCRLAGVKQLTSI